MHPFRILLALLLVAPAGAWACAPSDPNRVPDDRPIATLPDGSFSDAALDDGWSLLRGGRARDLGGGRVAQVIEQDYGCEIAQTLLFVDCTTAEALAIRGVPLPPDQAVAEGIALSTLALQAPIGPLRLTGSSTVAEVAALAAREGWTTVPDVRAWAAERGESNRFDPFRGCRMFHPGTPGAGA